MTYQVIYSSEASTPMQIDELEEVLLQARANNESRGITGALVYVEGVFLQILEGDADAVRGLMALIAKDVRHQEVTVLKEGEAVAASFSDWKMAYVSATANQVAQWAGLSGTTDIPQILGDLRRDSQRTMQLADGILSVLTSDPASKGNIA